MKLQRVFHFTLIFVTLVLMACGESNPSKGEENDLNNSSSSKINDILSGSSSSSSEEEVVK